MKKMIAMAVVCVAGGAFATVANDAMTNDPQVVVTKLSVNQRYPWNGKVDIDFTFTSVIPEAVAFVNFKAAYENRAGETVEVPMKTFEQISLPWCTNAGTYHVTWDAAADAPNLTERTCDTQWPQTWRSTWWSISRRERRRRRTIRIR